MVNNTAKFKSQKIFFQKTVQHSTHIKLTSCMLYDANKSVIFSI